MSTEVSPEKPSRFSPEITLKVLPVEKHEIGFFHIYEKFHTKKCFESACTMRKNSSNVS